MKTVDVTITLTNTDRYELNDDTAKAAHTVSLIAESLDGIIVWHRHLTIPKDREIVCGALRYPLVVTSISDKPVTLTLRYQLDKWTSMQLQELSLHDGIYYSDGYIEDFIY